MEQKLGRDLQPNERVRFRDGDRKNLVIDNLEVCVNGKKSLAAQRARLETKLEQIQAALDDLEELDDA
jgi:hypothetical protein